MTEDGFCVMQKLRGTKALVLGRGVHPSPPGLLSLTSGGRKIKKELNDRRLTLCHAKVKGTKVLALRRRVHPTTPGLLSLTSGGRKIKKTELDDRRLTLHHAKVGGKLKYCCAQRTWNQS